MNFGNIFPLLGLIILPIIFFIIRFYPPVPKEKEYSSFFLLKDIVRQNSSKTKFPLWLLIFRLLLCLLVILFFSDPYLTIGKQTGNYKNYTIIADNGWSIANNWKNYKNIIKEISIEAENKKKEIHFYFSLSENIIEPTILKSHNEVLEFIKKNPPLVQQTDRKNVIKILKKNNYFNSSKVFFIFSNFDSRSIKEQTQTLKLIKENNPAIEIINPVKKITFLEKVNINKERLELTIKRKGIYINNDFVIQIFGNSGEVLFKKKYTYNSNIDEYKITETFPIEIINQFFKIKILNENHAGAYFYLDDYTKRVSVGVIAEDESLIEKPLLSPVYYLKKSLNQNHTSYIASIKKILDKKISVIFLPSNKRLLKADQNRLKKWIKEGGVLVRFSDKNIIKQKDLYFDGKNYFQSLRNIAKDFSIQNKLSISSFTKNTLLSNLKVPKDLIFEKQLILDNYESDIIVLASLEDQSPLITMKNVGYGKVILFHITSNNEWSNLPLSSLFKDIISKLLLVPKVEKNLYSEEMIIKSKIDSFGELTNPLKNYYYVNNLIEEKKYPSFKNPAGIYENENLSIALNLSGNLSTQSFFSNIDERISIKNNYEKSIFKLKNFILILIFIMFFADMLINIILKNNILFLNFFKKSKSFSFLFVFSIILCSQNKIEASENYNKIFLAYIKTENNILNQIALSGLTNLKDFLIERTSISPQGVKEIDIVSDKIFFYPFIYWQITKNIPNLEEKTIKKIKNYFNSGGIILFDIIYLSKSYNNVDKNTLEDIEALFSELGIEDLQQITKNHTLSKSYYLLKKFPGRFDNKLFLVNTDNLDDNDGVSSVIVGLNNWVGAWAKDENNYPLYQVIPGGDRQRELSFRFGINLIMYSLTGNYKSDQVHSKSILERLKKK